MLATQTEAPHEAKDVKKVSQLFSRCGFHFCLASFSAGETA